MRISMLYPENFSKTTYKLSKSAQHDLGLDVICKEVAKSEDEERYILGVMSEMTDAPEVAAYRIEVFDDLIQNKYLRDDIMEILRKIHLLNEYGRLKKVYTDAPGAFDLIQRMEELKDYMITVETLYNCLKSDNIRSHGLLTLRDYVKELYEEQGFKELKEDINRLKVTVSSIKSVTLGINLNERFEAASIGLISINNEYFTKSMIVRSFNDMLSRKDAIKNGNEWNETYKYFPTSMAQIPDGDRGADIMQSFESTTNSLLNISIKKLKEVLSKYVTVTIDDMMRLLPEFTYYVRWAEYITERREHGYRFCRAVVSNQMSMHAEGIYDFKLACHNVAYDDIVTNDLDFSDDKYVYILTGANRGGKTTFTQAVGLCLVMAGGGIYVPGRSFFFTPIDCVYTHFPVDEENTFNLGRLGEECKRFHDLFLMATKSSLLLLNESFSTTSYEEGYYIAKDSVRAILDKGIRTIFNTHMYKLGHDVEEFNASSKGVKAASLITKTDGHNRTYKVVVASPEGTSLAHDIAEKYGVTYDQLMQPDNNLSEDN